ncbi:hypothetical protein HRbin09_02073 [bacterium HR09]|nr:hypothetical protein HRbin09_02073 [bacterium HR09]
MDERLVQGLVAVHEVHVFAHDANAHPVARVLELVHNLLPLGEVPRPWWQLEHFQEDVVQVFGGKAQRHFVNGFHGAGGDDRAFLHVAEERDLSPHFLGKVAIHAANQDVRLNTDGPQLLHRMLGGFGLELVRGRQVGHQRDVHVDGVAPAHVLTELADGLQKRQRLDVTHGAANFHDDHVVIFGHIANGGFNFIGNVRNHLHGGAQKVAPPLLFDDRKVHPAGGDVVFAGGGHGGKALVVP